jgi:hypothetical protein
MIDILTFDSLSWENQGWDSYPFLKEIQKFKIALCKFLLWKFDSLLGGLGGRCRGFKCYVLGMSFWKKPRQLRFGVIKIKQLHCHSLFFSFLFFHSKVVKKKLHCNRIVHFNLWKDGFFCFFFVFMCCC